MRWFFWMYLGCGLPWLGCLLLYGLRSPWRRTAVGRAMFTTYATLTAVLTLASALRMVRPPFAVAVGLAVGTLSLVGISGLVQLVLIWRAQQRRSR